MKISRNFTVIISRREVSELEVEANDAAEAKLIAAATIENAENAPWDLETIVPFN